VRGLGVTPEAPIVTHDVTMMGIGIMLACLTDL
jgi:hypothetical protein